MQIDPYSLDRMEDIVTAEPVSWWPLGVGWWFLVAIVSLWCIVWTVDSLQHWRDKAYRRAALKELSQLKCGDFVSLSTLLKRVALMTFERERVASLTGNKWLQFLSATCPGTDFDAEASQKIGLASSYPSPQKVDENQWLSVILTAERWIVGHRAEGSE